MKRTIALTILLVSLSSGIFASNYEEVMTANIEKMYQSISASELTNLANQFSRIANAEKKEWLPGYYAAFCYLRATYIGEMKAEEIHKHLDMARAELDKVLKKANDSEINALQAHIYQLRITDMDKGMKYSALANESLAVAEKLNLHNPRVYYLKGANIYHTPKMFGGGAENAKPLFEKAAKMFEEFKPSDKLMPNWGAGHNKEMLVLCNSEE
ncbi:MAG: hypothetical protein HQ541_02940 [Mariniphaga sp.]|nr:hypothetical protein [Mariniphaga sp.]